ncbi:MAG: zinc ribbon domain-containing protein [Polyangiaceae bacterium]|nr:zinc ribbon domain-containing protein [Polyangiaceae bacterium]
MSVCDACGADVDQGARFCGECGASIIVAQADRAASDVRGGAAKARSVAGKPGAKQRDATKDGKGRARSDGAAADNRELRSTMKGIATPLPPAPMSIKVPAPAHASTSTIPPVLQGAEVSVPKGDQGAPRTEFQRLLDEVESGFDAILVTGETTPPPPARSTSPMDDDSSVTSENQFDERQATELFEQLVVANAQPIRDFMIEVRLGEPHKSWLDHCEPSVLAILRSAEGMGLGELVGRVRRFLSAIEKARSLAEQSDVIRGEGREGLIDAYSELIAFFPEAFAAEAESNRREAAIVGALLSKVPGLSPLASARIYSTGLASLGLFYVSRPGELADLGAVSLEIAERIVERFRTYRKMASELSPARGREAERARLRQAVDEMGRSTRAYDQAAPTSSERRVYRRERLLAMADVSILLARLGEVERLRRIETMAFSARVEALTAFLAECERRSVEERKARK